MLIEQISAIVRQKDVLTIFVTPMIRREENNGMFVVIDDELRIHPHLWISMKLEVEMREFTVITKEYTTFLGRTVLF